MEIRELLLLFIGLINNFLIGTIFETEVTYSDTYKLLVTPYISKFIFFTLLRYFIKFLFYNLFIFLNLT